MTGRVFSKLFRREIIGNLRFVPNMKMHEDNIFSVDTMCVCNKIGVSENIWYEYHMNSYSATHAEADIKSIEDEFIFAHELYKRRYEDIRSAVDVRMIWIMKAICSVLRKNKRLKYLRKKTLLQMISEECFITAADNLNLKEYMYLSFPEKIFAVIVESPGFIKLLLLYIWMWIKI